MIKEKKNANNFRVILTTVFIFIFVTLASVHGQMVVKNSGGNELLRVTDTGMVGIGVTAPQGLLHVNGDIALGDAITTGTSYKVFAVTRPDAGKGYDLTIYAGWGRGMGLSGPGGNLILEGGRSGDTMPPQQHGNIILQPFNPDLNAKVGIGTTDPLERLDIEGAIRIANTSNEDPGNEGTIRFTGSDFEGYLKGTWTSLTSGVGGTGLWQQNGTSIYYNTGNVGIGTSAPSKHLTVVGSTFGLYTDWAAIGPFHGATMRIVNSGDLEITAEAQNSPGGPTAQKNVVFPYGRVGIGTTSPLAMLEVIDSASSGSSDLFEVRESTPGMPGPIIFTRFIVKNDGNVGIKTPTPPYTLTVGGEIMLSAGNNFNAQTGYAGIYNNAGELYAIDESGNSTKLSTHDKQTGDWIFYSKNIRTGRVVRVNMEKMVRKIEKITGEKFLEEYVEKE